MDDRNSNVGTQSLPSKCPFYPRVGHKSVRMNDEVLIFGGIGLSGEFQKTILRFNLQNFKIQPLCNAFCPNWEGFSLFTHKDTIYLWGGNLQNKFCNSLLSFRGTNFETCIQKGEAPTPRAFHCSCVIADKYLLIYGGFNETEIFNDWYILNLQTLTWKKVQPNRQLPKNVKFQLVWGNGHGYLVSEYAVSKSDSKLFKATKNQVFQIRIISFTTFKLRIDQLQSFQSQVMSPRSNFSLIFIDKQIWVLGGQNCNTTRQNQITLNNQIWTLNIQTLKWSKKPFTLNVKNNFQIIGFKNKLYLLGGLRTNNQISSSIEVVTTKNQNFFETQMCNFCKSVFSVDCTPHFNKINTAFQIQTKDQSQILTQISTNFISKLAKSLPNPIQAIGLLVENSLNMGASSISITINTPSLSANYFKENPSYLFIGDNSKSFADEQITKIMFSFRFKVQKYYRDHIDKQDIKMRNQYGLHLKLASLRLGTSCLFITTTIEESIFVSYFSDFETDCPDGDPSFNCFYYTINKEGICSNNLNRQIIRQNVKHLLGQNDFLNTKTHFTKVYICGLFDINKVEINNNKTDIGYSFHGGITLPFLSQYISSLYLIPFLGRQIFIQQNRVTFTNLISKLKEDERNGLIQQIDTSLELSIFVRIALYKVMKTSYAFRYVYVYHQNRLISAISSRQKTICGFIEIPQQIQVDFFKSKIEKWQEQRKLIGYIESKEQCRKRLRKTDNFATQDNQLHKIKSSYFQF